MPNMGESFEKLNDSNWGQWRMLMKALLVKKNLWGVVDGTEVAPNASPNTKIARAFRRKQAEAVAEIILHVDVTQLSFIQDENPETVWDALADVHQARGMSTRLALRRRFLRLQKPDGPMQNFIAEARRLALQLQEIGVTVDDEDIILVLTGGLPPIFDSFVITLDSLSPDNLTLNNVITRLLNEEARQSSTILNDAAMIAHSAPRRTRDISQITCYKCGKKGHYQSTCQEPPKESAAAVTAGDSDLEFLFD
jgi:hypothetical protein